LCLSREVEPTGELTRRTFLYLKAITFTAVAVALEAVKTGG
jgi:hypothetical protein